MKQDIEREDEIDLLALLLKLWKGKKTILKYFILFFCLGIFIAIFSKKEYTASSLVLAQEGNSSGGGITGLASLAGINISSSSSEFILPKLYPSIAQSIPFQKKMIQTLIQVKDSEVPITYQEYYTKYQKETFIDILEKYTIGLPSVIMSSKEEDVLPTTTVVQDSTGVYNISREERRLFSLLNSQFKITTNEKENTINLSFSMEEPQAAAQMLQQAENYLQETIIEFKTCKTKRQLDFIQKQYESAEKAFKEKQIQLAAFQDMNRGLISAIPMTRQTQLQSEYNLAYNLYLELAKQLETQKIKVQEDTPAFISIEPVSIPLDKSKPNKGMIIAIWSFLGIILGIAVIFGKDFLKKIKNKSQEE
ncbi:Wzz/FepE/Etk N-terminal domain-containing protein [uncultured Capnocytophaga sp.]|uniref:Wzz/FepE/Etk N-terminal domain-containing protein n=1 Tax=uncultured Capnocytophaga sp. TaxID=159273 RepID=UPI00260CADD1|nr:Wzz/FepE/Etk N-terminal domain-containing protein [uncultured Capnocytophaga sp.]